MGYLIGAGPLDPAVKRYNGGTSSFTMDNSGTTNGTLLWVDGVAQVPGTDYNVSGTTITTTTAAGAGTNNVTSLQLFNTGLITTPADNTVAIAKIQDDAVTLAKMAAGTDGNIISYDASGNPVAVATGSDGQVLTSSGAGAVCAFEDAGGGAWEFVSTSVASSSASVALTGLDSSADLWVVVFTGVHVATNSTVLWIRTSNDASSHSYEAGAADYGWGYDGWYPNTSAYRGGDLSDSEIETGGVGTVDWTNHASSAGAGMVYINKPADATYGTAVWWNIQMPGDATTGYVKGSTGSGVRRVAEANTAIQFIMSSGNIDAGRFTLYKVKHS